MNYPTENSPNNILAARNGILIEEDLPVFQKLLERDISDNTRKALILDLKYFVEWFVRVNGEAFSFARLTARDIVDYKRYCQEEKKNSSRTINRSLASIKALCKVARKEGKLSEDPSEDVKQLPLQPLAPKKLERSDLRALIKEAELRTTRYGKFIRDVLIMELLSGAGLRVSEVVNLNVSDVHISERKGYLEIINGKGGKTRKVPLSARLRELIQKYTEQYRPEKHLILGQRGRLTPIAINKVINYYAKKAGVKCSPHALRHSFAYNYLEQNPDDIVGLAQILGHESLNTTALYTKHSLDDLQERVEGM